MEKHLREMGEAVFDLLAAVGKHESIKKDPEVMKAFRELTKKRKAYLAWHREVNDGKAAKPKSPVQHHGTGKKAI